jgi:hypothetical protein
MQEAQKNNAHATTAAEDPPVEVRGRFSIPAMKVDKKLYVPSLSAKCTATLLQIRDVQLS